LQFSEELAKHRVVQQRNALGPAAARADANQAGRHALDHRRDAVLCASIAGYLVHLLRRPSDGKRAAAPIGTA
jgi:hypothetical protein